MITWHKNVYFLHKNNDCVTAMHLLGVYRLRACSLKKILEKWLNVVSLGDYLGTMLPC